MSSTPFISYAQNGEDVVLWRALGGRDKVVYVDVGAFDPTYDSVTKSLYERGWRGVNIEAQPARIAAFEQDRPLDTNLSLAISDEDGEAVLSVPANPGWATLLDPAQMGHADVDTEKITVPVRRLSTVFADLGLEHVDVLKIDVEGAEAAVVRGLLDGPVRPVVCVVEGVGPAVGREAGDEAVRLLVAAGYTHCLFDGLNHYLTTDPTLRDDLSLPASPIDGFVTDQVHRLSEEREALSATIAALIRENESLRRGLGGPTSQSAHSAAGHSSGWSSAAGRGTRRRTTPEPTASDLPAADLEPTGDADPSWAAPAERVVERRVFGARRRDTLLRLLTGDPETPLPVVEGNHLPGLLRLSSGTHQPADAVGVIYREILGRAPDPGGLLLWSRRIESGVSLLDVAHEVAATDEASNRSRSERQAVRTALATWQRMVAADRLGLSLWRGGSSAELELVGHRLFVNALFEVSASRAPNPLELAHEVDKLAAGVGREWMLRSFAARPDTLRRLFGAPGSGPREWVRTVRNRTQRLQVFRDLVTAAENRQRALLLNELSRVDLDVSSELEPS